MVERGEVWNDVDKKVANAMTVLGNRRCVKVFLVGGESFLDDVGDERVLELQQLSSQSVEGRGNSVRTYTQVGSPGVSRLQLTWLLLLRVG